MEAAAPPKSTDILMLLLFFFYDYSPLIALRKFSQAEPDMAGMSLGMVFPTERAGSLRRL